MEQRRQSSWSEGAFVSTRIVGARYVFFLSFKFRVRLDCRFEWNRADCFQVFNLDLHCRDIGRCFDIAAFFPSDYRCNGF